MAVIVFILGLLQMVGGVFFAVMAQSSIHQILAAIVFGFGVLAFALAVIIAKIDDATKGARIAPSPPDNHLVDVKHVPSGGWTRQ